MSPPGPILPAGTQYQPSPGNLRIWTADGWERRHKTDWWTLFNEGDYDHGFYETVMEGADYIEPGRPYWPMWLNMFNVKKQDESPVSLSATPYERVFYIEGIRPADAETITVEVDTDYWDPPFAPELSDSVKVTVVGLNLDMPNKFIALPDAVTQERISTTLTQQTTTDVRVVHVADRSDTPESVTFAITDGVHTTTHTYVPPSGSGSTITEVWRIILDEEWGVDNDQSELTFTLTDAYAGGGQYQATLKVPGKRLLSNIEFSPTAYKEDKAVCPYTHVHSPLISLTDGLPWYGLLMRHDITGSVILDDLLVDISGGDVGEKRLSVMSAAKWGIDCPGANRRVKWEGFDATIVEPAAEAYYCSFPAPLGSQYAPVQVVAEGDYQYRIEARDTLAGLGDPADLQQWHIISGIPIYVRYNMTDVEIVDPEETP